MTAPPPVIFGRFSSFLLFFLKLHIMISKEPQQPSLLFKTAEHTVNVLMIGLNLVFVPVFPEFLPVP